MSDELYYKTNQRRVDIESMYKAIEDTEKSYTEDELYSNLDWIEASGKMYEMNENKKFEGDHKALAKYGIDQMSEFNYNISLGMIPDLIHVQAADDDTKVAFAYLMDTYEKKDISLDGFGRAMKELVFDPLTYLAPGAIVGKKIVTKSAEELTKMALKEKLLYSLSSQASMGAVEGSIYSAGDEAARQKVYQEAGMMKEYNTGNIATSAVLGAGAGYGIVKGIKVGAPALVEGAKRGLEMGLDKFERSPLNVASYIVSKEKALPPVAGGGTPPNTFRKPLYDLGQEVGYIKTTREGDVINIDDIEVSKTGTGIGTNEIKDLMRNADRNGQTITLTSDAMRGKEGQKKNRALYEKLGFIKNSGKDKRKDITEEYYYQGKVKNEE